MMGKKRLLKISLYAVVGFLSGCTDPIEPEFEFREGLVFVEGFASTAPGASFVTINTSAIEFGVYVVNFLEGATVSFEKVNDGESIILTEIDGTYVAPPDFRVVPGEEWKLKIVLPNGVRYESFPETVLESVPVSNLEVRYDPELEFRELFGGKFVPGHEVLVSFDDPPDRDNYYYWTYRTYENLDFCEKCFEGVFREGECQRLGPGFAGFPYFDYTCESECWRIRFPESIAVFEDEFANGKNVSNVSIGNLLLYTKEDMVVEVQQFSLTPEAYRYYKVLKDIVDNSSGLNAPPPAALVGNMFNPEDDEDFVFGRFTAAATSTAALFIDRTLIEEQPLETRDPIRLEPTFNSPLPPPPTTSAPCSETRFRTAIRPELWIDQ